MVGIRQSFHGLASRVISPLLEPLKHNQQYMLELYSAINARTEDIQRRTTILQEQNDILNKRLDDLQQTLHNTNQLTGANYNNVQWSIRKLHQLRKTELYNDVFNDTKPLITIRIATYNRAEKLMTVAIPSILKQTYQNFEVIIVGDHCTDDTAERIAALNDPRFHFFNLPHQTVYPEDRIQKWQVIGAPPMNLAASLAKGKWIAPLDDDDIFEADHLKTLLDLALREKGELVYGTMLQKNEITHKTKKIYAYPPSLGQISLQGAIYMTALDDIFKYDPYAWMLNVPADWLMVKHMMDSGVRIIGTEKVVGTLNMIPAGHGKKDY